MAETAREYLIHRFRGDAHALRERTAALKGGAKIPGPDASTSARMAEACETVVGMLEEIGAHDDLADELAALVALIPRFESLARTGEQSPPVRAVYAGAATRIREVETAEANATGERGNNEMADADDDADFDDE